VTSGYASSHPSSPCCSFPSGVATRQTSSSGRPKSPRIQVVLPEDLCERLAQLAAADSRTVSNMAKVLIQQGVERLEQARGAAGAPVPPPSPAPTASADQFRQQLEQQGQGRPQRLRGAPRRLRLQRPS
jgi:hypothetical protein